MPVTLLDDDSTVATKQDRAKSWETYTRFTLVICAILLVQDSILDALVAYELHEKEHEVWAYAYIFFILLPPVLLVLINAQVRRFKMAAYALFGFSIFVELRDSWELGVETRFYTRETDLRMIFQTIPQFFIQSQLVLSSHFLAKRCEEAFDLVCTAQCSLVDGVVQAPFTRFSCQTLNFHTQDAGADEKCWANYAVCMKNCAAFELLDIKCKADEDYIRSWTKLKSSVVAKLKVRKKLAAQAFQEAMLEDAPAWGTSFCDAKGSGVQMLMVPGMDAGIPTLHRSVFFLWTQLPAMFSAALTIALSRAFRTVDERSDENIETKAWIIRLCSFGFHFLFDMFALCGGLAIYLAATHHRPLERGISFLVVIILFQVVVNRVGIYRNKTMYRRVMAGMVYILLSPLVRLPSFKPLTAYQIRVLLRTRVVLQIALCTVGLARMGTTLANKTPFQEFKKELSACFYFIVGGIIFTNTPGTNEVWGKHWDITTRDYLTSKELTKFDNRRKAKMLCFWHGVVKAEQDFRKWEEDTQRCGEAALDFTERRWEPEAQQYMTLQEYVDLNRELAPMSDIFMYWQMECIPEGVGEAHWLDWMEEDGVIASHTVRKPKLDSASSAGGMAPGAGDMAPTKSGAGGGIGGMVAAKSRGVLDGAVHGLESALSNVPQPKSWKKEEKPWAKQMTAAAVEHAPASPADPVEPSAAAADSSVPRSQ